jgi:molecular chaperone DnaK
MVGEPAREGLDRDPDATIFGVKRLLGRRFDHPEIRKLVHALPYELIESPHGDTWIRLPAGRVVSPEEVSAHIFGELKRTAERFFGAPVTRAVLAIPAWYDAAQRQAVKDAAQIAGLLVVRLLSEPTAAVLGHSAHQRIDRRYLVCDLGGGTFDVTAVDVESGVFEVLATAADPFLGGDDVDRWGLEYLVRDLRTSKSIDIAADAIAIERLRRAVQLAKHELSDRSDTQLALKEFTRLPSGESVDYVRRLQREELERWCSALRNRLEVPVGEVLRRCSRERSDVEEVLLIGGGTRMPMVRNELHRIVGREPAAIQNPQQVVAIGAALEVARLAGIIDGVSRIDVASRGIAMSVQGSDCESIIAQSAVVPTREQRVLATRYDEQSRLEFDLWEGESKEPANNRHLGRYAVVDLPPASGGDVVVVLDVVVDADGLVRVGATELASGEQLGIEAMFQAGLSRAEVSRLARQFAAPGIPSSV